MIQFIPRRKKKLNGHFMICAIFQMYQLRESKLEVHIEWTTIKHDGKKIFLEISSCVRLLISLFIFFFGVDIIYGD